MGEMSELDKWVLETAKDIDSKLNERASNWKETIKNLEGNGLNPDKWKVILETQETRIELLKAIMQK